MKIISSEVNADGHFQLFVEYRKRVTLRDTVIIPTRQFLIERDVPNKADLEAMSDEEYFAMALESCRAKCEDEPGVDSERKAQSDALVGRVIKKRD